jgi:hypothetical protein
MTGAGSHAATYADYSHGVRIVCDQRPWGMGWNINGTREARVVEDGAARVAHESGWARDAEFMNELYKRERPVRFKIGTCVLYCLDTWHRGTPVNLGSWRYTQHTVWRAADSPFIGFQSFAPNLAGMPPRYIASLSPAQRTIFGIPPPGDKYWTKATAAAAALRYGPGFQVDDYVRLAEARL